MTEELKPCPKCKHKAVVFENFYGVAVQCGAPQRCGFDGTDFYANKSRAIKEWDKVVGGYD